MTKYIGRQIDVGFGLEGTRGTAVGIQNWQPKTELSFKENNETIQDESSIGVIVDSRDSHLVKRWAEGDIGGNIEVNSIGYLLYALLGSVSVEAASTGAYTHTFTLNNTNQGKTLTIGTSEPNGLEYEFALGSIESMTISANEGEQATFTVTFKSKPGSSTTHTVSYSTDYKLLSRHSAFYLADTVSGLDSADSICLKSFEINFTRNLMDDYCLGSKSPEDFVNQQFQIDGSFSLLFEGETYKNYVLDNTQKSVRFMLQDTDTTIGASDNPTLKIDLPLASMTEWDKSMGNDEVVQQTITYKGMYDNNESSAIDVYLTNTVSEYTDGS